MPTTTALTPDRPRFPISSPQANSSQTSSSTPSGSTSDRPTSVTKDDSNSAGYRPRRPLRRRSGRSGRSGRRENAPREVTDACAGAGRRCRRFALTEDPFTTQRDCSNTQSAQLLVAASSRYNVPVRPNMYVSAGRWFARTVSKSGNGSSTKGPSTTSHTLVWTASAASTCSALKA